MRIIPRSEWGAIYPRGFRSAPLPASEVWLHHSVTIAPDLKPPFTDDYAAVRTLERIGQQRFGGGISYTFAVTPAGLVFEGHGVDRQGAHTAGRNSIARAICMIGDYSKTAPTALQKNAIAELLIHGKNQGWWKTAKLNGGHRNAPGASTACPGNAGFAVIAEINRLVTATNSGVFMALTDAEQKELLQKVRDIHWQERTNLDWTKHGNPNVDNQYGHTMGIRLMLKKLQDTLTAIQNSLSK